MTFVNEAALVKALLLHAPSSVLGNANASRRGYIVCEMQLGALVPDVVVVSHLEQRFSVLSALERWVLAEWLAGHADEKTITRRLAIDPSRVVRAVKTLETVGLLVREASGGFSISTKAPFRMEVVAIEAKLLRWREAMRQACRYVTFSTRSYIALPSVVVQSSKGVVEACERDGIGLLSVSRRAVRVVRRSALHSPNRRDWLWAIGKASKASATRLSFG